MLLARTLKERTSVLAKSRKMLNQLEKVSPSSTNFLSSFWVCLYLRAMENTEWDPAQWEANCCLTTPQRHSEALCGHGSSLLSLLKGSITSSTPRLHSPAPAHGFSASCQEQLSQHVSFSVKGSELWSIIMRSLQYCNTCWWMLCSLVQNAPCNKELLLTTSSLVPSHLCFHFRLGDLPKARDYIRMEFLALIFALLDVTIALNFKHLRQNGFETPISSNTTEHNDGVALELVWRKNHLFSALYHHLLTNVSLATSVYSWWDSGLWIQVISYTSSNTLAIFSTSQSFFLVFSSRYCLTQLQGSPA